MKVAVAVAAMLFCAATVLVSAPAGRPAVAGGGKMSGGERRWVAAAEAFTRDVQDRVELAAAGGSDLASARWALHETSNLFAMLVAYAYFDSCSRTLQNVGNASVRLLFAARTLRRACQRFERASALFGVALRRDDPAVLLAATRESLQALVPVVTVRVRLERLVLREFSDRRGSRP